MGCYLGVIGKRHNDEYFINVFAVKVLNGTPGIFNKLHYHCWYKELTNKFSTVTIATTHMMFIFKIKLMGRSQEMV